MLPRGAGRQIEPWPKPEFYPTPFGRQIYESIMFDFFLVGLIALSIFLTISTPIVFAASSDSSSNFALGQKNLYFGCALWLIFVVVVGVAGSIL